MAEVWISALVAGGVGLVGAGVSLYGANKNAKAQAAATAANSANAEGAQQENWRRYGLQRGVDFTNGQIVNTKLPLWAGVARNGAGAVSVKTPYVPSGSFNGTAGAGAGTNYNRGWAGLGITR